MRAIAGGLMTAALVASIAATGWAQTKVLPVEMETVKATVEAIDASTRTITLKGPKGDYVEIVVPRSVTRFSEIKVGDTLTARYYENIVLRVQQAGEKPVDTYSSAITKGPGATPGGTDAIQRTITATITEIDQEAPSITFTGPNNWKYSSRVEDRKALAKVKVGDKVDITWTAAMLVSFEHLSK